MIIKTHDEHKATPPVIGVILSCEDLSLGIAKSLSFIDNFLTTSNNSINALDILFLELIIISS